MKKIVFFFLLIAINSLAQNDLNHLLKKYNTANIPYISVDSLNSLLKTSFDITQDENSIILLDAREEKEFMTSHLQGAKFVGYDTFNIKKNSEDLPNKNAKIVVYCSLGIRSEKVAEKLKKAGYTDVFNLYGGIFEWKNNEYLVYNSNGEETEKVHIYTQEWSKWLLKGEKIDE